MAVGHRGEKVQVQIIGVWACHCVRVTVVSTVTVVRSEKGSITVKAGRGFIKGNTLWLELAAHTSTLAGRTGQTSMSCSPLRCVGLHYLVVSLQRLPHKVLIHRLAVQ